MTQLLRLFFILPLLFGCNSETAKDPELGNLVKLLVGEFSNESQVKEDAGFAYLHLVNTVIWEDRPGYWVYSEVYDPRQGNFIYSQRILEYEKLDSASFKSTSYKILNAKGYERGWEDKKIFNKLTMDSLEVRQGCEIYFEKNTSTIYSGKTNKGFCSSSINNVEYITANLVISKNKISIWNRGYNNEGKQIWGKINGPYKYKRVKKNN